MSHLKISQMKIKIFIIILLHSNACFAQGVNDEKVSLSNFIKRMHTAAPFEGVKIMDDYDHQYLISVISLDTAKYTDPSVMNRVAQVKAQSQANTFLNGATITMDMVIRTVVTSSKDSTNTIKDSTNTTRDSTNTFMETIETIKQRATGFTQGLELLTTFGNADGKRMVFVYSREVVAEK